LPVGLFANVLRHNYSFAVECIVVSPVLELVADPTANLETEIGSNGHVAMVEQGVNVASEE